MKNVKRKIKNRPSDHSKEIFQERQPKTSTLKLIKISCQLSYLLRQSLFNETFKCNEKRYLLTS